MLLAKTCFFFFFALAIGTSPTLQSSNKTLAGILLLFFFFISYSFHQFQAPLLLSMEAPDYFHGGYLHAAIAQYSPEMKAAAGAGERDQFVVEDLLDFSNEEQEEDEAAAGALVSGDEGGLDAAAWNSTDESTVSAVDSCGNSLCGGDAHLPGDALCRSFADTTLSGDICQPHYDEIAELEWLSNFVDESSFSSDDLHKLHVNSGVPSTADAAATAASSASSFKVAAASATHPGDAAQPLIFRPEAPIPGKARGKRSRVAPGSWASRLLVLPPSTNAALSPESEFLVPPSSGTVHVGKKAAKEKDPSARGASAPNRDGRKCLHCQTDKTPQWRTGPMGPKTLCNACGVRYKSGRLVPEYRPAASPTFVLSKHSNSHRKVLELRRQKEIILQQQQQQQLLGPAAAGGELYDAPPSMAAATDDFLVRHGFGPDLRQLI